MRSRLLSIILISAGSVLISMALLRWWQYSTKSTFLNPLGSRDNPEPAQIIDATSLSFPNLRQYSPQAGPLELESILSEEEAFISYLFSYTSEGKVVTGQLNLPQTATPSAGFPVVVMLRGFVDPAQYQTGIGTRNAAAVFARNGYATVAPDFLGFGNSSPPHSNAIMARLERPTTVINLLASLDRYSGLNSSQLFFWAHSNGGQIALSVLQVTGRNIPTTLWAPVSKSFPYSVLYYTDEYEDQGKALRKLIADFEVNHNIFDYSIDRYWSWIQAPIQLHQGGADDAIPLSWSDELAATLEENGVEVEYHRYPSADHNLQPDWNTVVQRDIQFFDEYK